MTIGILKIFLHINESRSLKEKRMVLKALKDRLRNFFNISISEIGEQEKWQSSQLCIVCVNADRKYVNRMLSKIIEFIQAFSPVEIVDYQMEFI